MDAPIENDVENNLATIENNHLANIENGDELSNMETDELVNMDDDHHQLTMEEDHHHQLVIMEDDHHELVNMEENHQLVSLEDNQLEPYEDHQLVPIENSQLASIEYNPLASIENDQLVEVVTPPSNRHRKKKSVVWEHFTIETVSADCRRACCKQCKQSFAYSTGSKVAGTSHLKRHIAKGTCPVSLRNRNRNQTNNNDIKTPLSAPVKISNGTDPPKRRYRTAAVSTTAVPYLGFNPERCRNEISKMIIMHEYPLHIVEHPGFVAFVKSLQPRFDMVSFDTVQGDCVTTYMREKVGVQKSIETLPGRICLAVDMWGSSLTTGYVFLTGSYVDTDWKIRRKLLNVVKEPYPESDSAFSHAVSSCLSDWNMEGRLFSLTLNQPLSEGSVENLRGLLSIRKLNEQLLVGMCLARSLSSLAREALTFADDTVNKVRDSVKYIKTSESHEEKFLELKQQLQVPSTKTLGLDDTARWNTTYEMLLAASELKEVFSCLDTSDPDYKEAPSMEVWKQVEILCSYLKLIFETASILVTQTSPTTNLYFHEVWKIQLELIRGVQKEDAFMCSLSKVMKEKFDEYWKSCSAILAIAVVMDPRFKMKLVEFSFSKIYGEDWKSYFNAVYDGIRELYIDYVEHPLSSIIEEESGNGGTLKINEGQIGLCNDGLGLSDFDMYIEKTRSEQSRTELEQYLEESLLPRVHEFDVLGWWKLNKTKYPTLSKMARDILTIPVCTLSPGSVFDTKRREMDNYRCSLKPETVEALICAKDWLKSVPVKTSSSSIKMEFPI